MFILASSSPRREMLLKQVGCEFRIVVSSWQEKEDKSLLPQEIVQKNALGKARSVAATLKKDDCDNVVIGADTIVVHNDIIYGKPRSKEDAFEMLHNLMGCKHTVITGVAVVCGEKVFCATEETDVFMRVASDNEIKNYVDTGEPMDKAGAYAIQGKGALFVKRIEGCYANVVGLPLVKLDNLLKNIDLSLL